MQGMRSADAPVVGGEKMRPPVEYTRLGMRLLELYFADKSRSSSINVRSVNGWTNVLNHARNN